MFFYRDIVFNRLISMTHPLPVWERMPLNVYLRPNRYRPLYILPVPLRPSAEPTNVVAKDKILLSPFASATLTVMGICRCGNSQNLFRIETRSNNLLC